MFSIREKEVIKIIGRKKLTLTKIAYELFKNEPTPFNSRISAANTVRRIMQKCSFYELKWSLEKNRVDSKLFIKKIKIGVKNVK